MLINNNVYIDYQPLRNITEYLHALTDAQIAVLDSEGRTVYGIPEKQQPFCSAVSEKLHDRELCAACDVNAVQKCKETFDAYTYICHAGVSETLIPLIYEKKIYLYLMLGQYINPDKEDEQRQAFCRYREGKNDASLEEEYDKLPRLTTKKVNAFIQIAKLLFISMWNTEIIKVRRSDLFLEIEKFIDKNLSSPLTVQTICTHFFISKNTLYQIFEEFCGMTIKKFIIEKRINYAKTLLTSTELTITDISEKVGMSSYGVFIHLFKNVVGISPTKYRKTYSPSVKKDD